MTEPKTWKHRYLNAFVVYFLVGPAMGVAWNSIWLLLSDVIIYPENKEISVWISFGVGYGGSFLAAFFQDEIHRFSTSHGLFFFIVVSRLYSYAMFFVSGNAWRAIWEGLDFYTGISEKNALVTGLASYAALLILRSSRQVVFAPCVLSMDFPLEDYFKSSTYFGIKRSTGTSRGRLGDTLFSIGFVGTLGFAVWRGFWQFIDIHLYPGDHSSSGFASLVICYVIMVGGVIVEPLLVSLSKKLYSTNYLLGLIHEDIVILFYIIACINFWRGYGLVYEVYVPGGILRFWLGHYVCCVLLFFSMAFNSVIARGVAVEGEETDGQGVAAGIEYLGNFTQLWKSRPENVKRSTCWNMFNTCNQAWKNETETEPPASIVSIQAPDESNGKVNSMPKDEVSLVLEKSKS